MPDTPKSFEEWNEAYEAGGNKEPRSPYRQRMDAWNAAIVSLTPKTAPDLDLLEGLATRREGDEGYLLPIRYRQPLLCLIAAARQAASPETKETAVGEGELPEEARCEYCGTADTDHVHKNGHRCCGTCCSLHGELATEKHEYEFVCRIVDNKNRILALFREAIAQRDEARGERDLYLRMIEAKAMAATAAPDVPRPEEIERLEWYAREPTHKHDALEWYEFIATPDLILRLLSRLRSLPSEPQDGNRKAAENEVA